MTIAAISTVWKVGGAENLRIIASLVSLLSEMREEHFTDCAEGEKSPFIKERFIYCICFSCWDFTFTLSGGHFL